MSEIKKEAATLEENYNDGIDTLQSLIEDGVFEDFEDAFIYMKEDAGDALNTHYGVTKAEIKALLRFGPPKELDVNTQKDMLLVVKALGCLYFSLEAVQGSQDPDLRGAIQSLIESIKKLDIKEKVFFNIRRHLIGATKEDQFFDLISRSMRNIRGDLNTDREVIYASRAVHIFLDKVKQDSVREIAGVVDNTTAKELKSLINGSGITELLLANLRSRNSKLSNEVRKNLNSLAEIFGGSARTASETSEVQSLVKALRENRESGKSVSVILREQNKIIEQAQNDGELDTSIVEVIKVLNEAQVLVVDSEHQSEIGAELGLTSEQEKAMLSDGRTIISAGAGSGKTRVLSGKVAHLIKGPKQADPYSIIACSFSRKSAKDLKKKIEEVVGKSLKNIEYTTIGRTTHSIAIEFINRFDPSAGDQKIVDEKKLNGFVKRAIELVKITPTSGQSPQKESFWSEKITPETSQNKRDDLRILSMIYTLESWREDNGYEKTGIPAFIKGLREQYKSDGPDSVSDEQAQRVMAILSTKRGARILARSFGGDQDKILNYSFPTTKSSRGRTASEDSMWWGNVGAGSQGKEVKFPSVKKCQLFITKCKARMLSPSEAFLRVKDKGGDFELKAKVYGAYQHLLNIEERMDFDDVLIRATRLLSYKKNLDEVKNQYKHIIVDEAQDLNPVQHAFFGMIAGTYEAKSSSSKPVPVADPKEDTERSFTLIGDENQSIYGFRGATSQEFTSKSKTNSGSFDLMSIGINFRSGENIVNAANRLASGGLGLSCVANIKSGNDQIKHESKKDANTSARDFADMVLSATQNELQTSEFSDFGIACRTNAEIIPYALALLEKDIPFSSGVNPFNHPSTKAIIRVMGSASTSVSDQRNALYNSWKDFGYDFPSNFDTALNNLSKSTSVDVEDIPVSWEKEEIELDTLVEELGLDDEGVLSLEKYMEMIAHWSGQGQRRPSEAFDIALGHKPIYSEEADFFVEGPDGKTLSEILGSKLKKAETEYLSAMGSSEEPDTDATELEESDPSPYAPLPALRSLFNKYDSVTEALDKLRTMKLKAEAKSVSQDENAVVLDTVHGWKGLEVTNLYVPMVAGKFPSDKVEFDPIVHESMDDAIAEKAEQERKLAYVAVTRGMKNVTVLSYELNDKGEELQPSEYISKMGLDCGSKTASVKLATALEILSESLIIEDDDMSDAEIDEALGIY